MACCAFLYTDGLSEARCPDEEYGVGRVTRVVRQAAAKCPAELVAAFLSDLRTFVDGPPFDDLTLLSIQRMA
jgi:serine phosphatase RsbU (regulator of sigma subunit)